MPIDLDTLITSHIWMAKTIALQVWCRYGHHPAIDIDELESEGLLGLVQAARTYNPGRGPFQRFAWTRVSGAMIDGMRARSSQSGWSRNLGRYASTLSFSSLDQDSPDWIDTLIDPAPGPDEQAIDAEQHTILLRYVHGLSLRERTIIAGVLQDVTQTVIGRDLCLSQGHVSQLLHGIVVKLRARAV